MNEQEIRERLFRIDASSIVDAIDGRNVVSREIQPFFEPIQIAGPAFTVQAPAGEAMAGIRGVTEAPPGSVVVINTSGCHHLAPVGEMASITAQRRGLAGLVCDGPLRDKPAIRRLGFPVYARGVALKAVVRGESLGELGVPVELGGVTVRPGDWIVGDDDGLVVVPAAELEAALERAEASYRLEDRVRNGEDIRIVKGFTQLVALMRP
ncbi:MAG: RraA family protein [Chloroflexi bacterium]|nr:RraA family protein [Chloroflexota bacterium]